MSHQYPNNYFSPLSESHLEQVLCWRNTPRIKANMHNDSEISWDEHLGWFSGLKSDVSREFWVLHQNSRPIGVLNFSCIGQSKVEWGCYLGETNVWPGTGLLLEVAALDRAVTFVHAKELVAEVLSFNKSAIGMHKFFKYPLAKAVDDGYREGKAYQRLYYEYPLSYWLENRASVLAKLPRALKVMAELLDFRESV